MPSATHRSRLPLALILSGLAACLVALALPRPDPPIPTIERNGMVELSSREGLLAVTLRAASGKLHIGDLQLDGATYNGLYAGPVLRVQPGDMLRIRLVNDLDEPTNLHFHGMRSSPLGNGDNVHIAVAPGASFSYEVRIPATQPPGLYWYHSHVHGASERQVMNGLSGALVVEHAPAAGQTERLFVLKDMVFDDDTGDAKIDDTLHGIVQSINGQLDTQAAMAPSETQLWRFSNQSADLPFHIKLDGHSFRIIAEDGEATIQPRTVDVLDIMPASRVDVLVAGGPEGRFALRSLGVMTGTGAARTPDRILGHLDVAGAPVTSPSPPPDQPAPPPADLRTSHIDARRTVVFTQTKTLKAEDQRFFINGKEFDPERVDLRVPLGNIEEWTIRNDTDDLHIFHIHQLGFQVVEVNGTPVAFNGRVDTIRVPERGEVKLRMAFTDKLILGRFVFHCHVLKHEDRGMMAQIEVYDPHPPALRDWVWRTYLHLWWWSHGVPWSQCGLDLT